MNFLYILTLKPLYFHKSVPRILSPLKVQRKRSVPSSSDLEKESDQMFETKFSCLPSDMCSNAMFIQETIFLFITWSQFRCNKQFT